MVYCKIVECEVTIENGDCSMKIGSPKLGMYSCPNKNSLVCPIKSFK